MRHILLESLLAGLDDLLTKRRDALESFANGAANVPLLVFERDGIAALPAALLRRPPGEELDVWDTRHEGLGGGIWFLVEAYVRHPDTTPALVEAARKIRAAFIPVLDGLTARDHTAVLASLKPELSRFPVAGGTLYDWAAGFVAAGAQLEGLRSQRADAEERAAAAQLRVDAVGTLNRLRKSLAAEARYDPTLPEDLDAQVFAYFDLLEIKATEAYADARKKASAAWSATAARPDAPGGPAKVSVGARPLW
jgi:hypothetical protein